MAAAPPPPDTAAPPAALPRAPGWRDAWRLRRARRHGVRAEGPVAIGRGVRFDLAPGTRLTLGAGVAIGDGCRFHLAAGEVRLGAQTVLGERCVLAVHDGVTLGARCRLGDEVVLVDFDHRFDDAERPVRAQGLATAPVVVGDDVRVGPGAVILRGVTVGAGARVGAHAVVTHDVAPGAVADGIPAAAPTRRPAPRRARGGAAPR